MTTGKYPTALLTLADLFGELPNFPELVLSGAHNASTTSIVVTTAIPATWPQAAWITIDTEILRVTSWAVSTFTVAARDGSAANSQTTTAATHASGAKVGLYLTAVTVNQMMVDLIAVETALRAVPFEHLATDRWEWYWAPDMTIEQTFTGTGVYTPNTIHTSASLGSGATSGSTAGLRRGLASNLYPASGLSLLKRWSFIVSFVDIDANTSSYIFLTNESVTTVPSLTVRHVGIKNIAGVVSFSTADGTTEQTTNITAFVTAANDNRFTVTFDGTTARLYIDGTLRATHATNVPTAAAAIPIFRLFITNAAASAKQIVVGRNFTSFAVV